MVDICLKVVRLLGPHDYRSSEWSPIEIRYKLNQRIRPKMGPIFAYGNTPNARWSARNIIECMSEIGRQEYRILECKYEEYTGPLDGIVSPLKILPKTMYSLFWSDDPAIRKGIQEGIGDQFFPLKRVSDFYVYANWVKPIREVPLVELPGMYDLLKRRIENES